MTPYYQDEFVTLYHGDNREIAPQLGKFDLLLTDPPFGIGFAAQPTKWQRRAGSLPELWDNARPDGLFLECAPTQIIWGGGIISGFQFRAAGLDG